MELFLLEHKKLWRKQVVKICVLLCFVYIVVFGSILSFQWFIFGSLDDYTREKVSTTYTNVKGSANRRSRSEEIAADWRGRQRNMKKMREKER